MTHRDPAGEDGEALARDGIWMRGLWMLVLVFLFGLAEAVLFAATVVQFLWILVKRERNRMIADFGAGLANWLAITARYQTGQSDRKPFPWTAWE
ncbi:DUF4389 domain-containing protein [Rhodovulum sp. YNF3179]|uniref:DUF4389 domain-containing protein n=1 Tax=Rhodovulum sp. YNF3179 TaxID=3425127 RepID=UPI003D355111